MKVYIVLYWFVDGDSYDAITDVAGVYRSRVAAYSAAREYMAAQPPHSTYSLTIDARRPTYRWASVETREVQ